MIPDQDNRLVVSDLDGTLLDYATYSFSAAREALDAINVRNIPLVIATSKTLAEVRPLAVAIGGDPILIVENGGAALIPAVRAADLAPGVTHGHGEPLVIEMGVPRDVLVRELDEIAAETGISLLAFNHLSTADISRLTGLSHEASRLAGDRAYDEPFLLERDDQCALIATAARQRGLLMTRGGRFCHLSGPTDKGFALAEIVRLFADHGHHFYTIGLGDAPNDLSFLQLVDRPIIMPSRDDQLDPQLAAALPHGARALDGGPIGWNDAVLAVLAGRRLAAVSEAWHE